MAEQNKGLAGIFNDPNFITGMSVLAANADPRRHWSEGYKDASERLSAMERSALNRAELEMRKQKFDQERKAIEQQQAAAAALRERLAQLPEGASLEERINATIPFATPGQALSAYGTLAGMQKTPDMSLEEMAFNDWQSKNPDKGYLDFLREKEATKLAGKGTPSAPKAPSGYKWVDENNPEMGLEPIPGGPATKISSGDVGKIAVSKEALSGLNRVDSMISDESGRIDRRALQAANLGTPGVLTPKGAEIRQAYYQAVEMLLRLKTGAAAQREEVEQNVELYMPKATDSDELIRQKQNALKRILSETVRLSEQGKGGSDVSAETTEEGDLLGAADRIVEGL